MNIAVAIPKLREWQETLVGKLYTKLQATLQKKIKANLYYCHHIK